MKKLGLLFLVTALLSGCTHLTSVSSTSIPARKGSKVSAEREKFIFVGFNFNNDYVNEMAAELAEQCPNGKVQGLLTKTESVVYFPILVHKMRVSATGFCVKGS